MIKDRIATICIHRKSAMTDAQVAYDVLVDGFRVGDIGVGEQRTFEIDEGAHDLQVCYSGITYGAIDVFSQPGKTISLEFGLDIPGQSKIRVVRMIAVFATLFGSKAIYEICGSPALPSLLDISIRAIGLVLFVLALLWFGQASIEVIKLIMGSFYYLREKHS